MGIASLILGIITIILAFIPCLNVFTFIPSVVGLILGIIACVLANNKQMTVGASIAGIILNAVALLVFVVFVIVLTRAAVAVNNAEKARMEQSINEFKK